MERIIAVVLVGIGLLLVGVALGLLYIDLREYSIYVTQAELEGLDADDVGAMPFVNNLGLVIGALFSGSFGAAMTGAGLLLAFFQLPIVRKRGEGRYDERGDALPA